MKIRTSTTRLVHVQIEIDEDEARGLIKQNNDPAATWGIEIHSLIHRLQEAMAAELRSSTMAKLNAPVRAKDHVAIKGDGGLQ